MMKNIYEGYTSFLGDVDKMHDFITMSMDDFLAFYSYLDREDYYATYDDLMDISRSECHSHCGFCESACAGCAYEKVCGDDERIEPCEGRKERD